MTHVVSLEIARTLELVGYVLLGIILGAIAMHILS